MLYLVNEITIAKSKNDNLTNIETIGFHAQKLEAKLYKDENMINCSSDLLPLMKIEGYNQALTKSKSTNFECRLSTEITLNQEKELHKVLGLFTLWDDSDIESYRKCIDAANIYIKNVVVELPRNFETGLMKKFTNYTQFFKPTIEGRELKV